VRAKIGMAAREEGRRGLAGVRSINHAPCYYELYCLSSINIVIVFSKCHICSNDFASGRKQRGRAHCEGVRERTANQRQNPHPCTRKDGAPAERNERQNQKPAHPKSSPPFQEPNPKRPPRKNTKSKSSRDFKDAPPPWEYRRGRLVLRPNPQGWGTRARRGPLNHLL
jgi:hypothetical protein